MRFPLFLFLLAISVSLPASPATTLASPVVGSPYQRLLQAVASLGLPAGVVAGAAQPWRLAAADQGQLARFAGLTTPALPVGSIHGEVRGRARSTASLFHVSLYGEGGYQLIRSLPLDRDRGYRFEGLPDGAYWLEIETHGPTGVRVSPSGQWIEVRQGQAVEQHVTLE